LEGLREARIRSEWRQSEAAYRNGEEYTASRRRDGDIRGLGSQMSVSQILKLVEDCLRTMDYLNAIYRIWGVGAEEIPEHINAFNYVIGEQQRYSEILRFAKKTRTTPILTNARELIQAYTTMLAGLNETKKQWKTKFIPIFAPDAEIIRLGFEIKRRGSVSLTKSGLQARFDVAAVIPGWQHLPGYTRFFLGAGLRMSARVGPS